MLFSIDNIENKEKAKKDNFFPPRLRSRPKLVYDQTQSSTHPCVPRPKLQGLYGSSSALKSGRWSGDGLIRGNFGLKSLDHGLEMVWSEVNFVWKVWSKADSSPLGSDQKCFRTQLGLIRDNFERPVFYWEMLALPRGKNKAAFWSETHLKSDSSVQRRGVQLIAKVGPIQRTFWSIGDYDVSYGKLFKLIHWIRNKH